MISQPVSLFQWERRARAFAKWGALASLAFTLFLFCFFLFTGSSSKENAIFPINSCATKTSSLAMEIERMPFPTERGSSHLSIPDLPSQILYLGKNERPDCKEEEQTLLFYFPCANTKWVTSPNSTAYLSYKSQKDGKNSLALSEEISPLMVRPLLLPDGRVQLQATLLLRDAGGETLLKEEALYDLDVCQGSSRQVAYTGEEKKMPAIAFLKSAKAREPDKLFELLPDEGCRGKHRIEIIQGEREEMLFVKEKDILAYKEGLWKKASLGQESRGFPLAQVRSISPHRIELGIWDAQGFLGAPLSLPLQKNPPPSFRPEEMFSRIRRRTTSTVSLRLCGRSMFLKRGDWLMLDSGHWRAVRSRAERAKIIQCDPSSELFVFQGLEKEGSKVCFKGHLFDAMRNSSLDVRIPLAAEKKVKSSRKALLEEKMKTLLKEVYE